MKVGLLLNTFQDSFDDVLAKVREAEDAGLDGVFCYDHLWPIGHPGMPALSCFPVLSAMAASTSRISIGTLVARVSLYGDMMVRSFEAINMVAFGRVIAGIGTGDSRSQPEDHAYGISHLDAHERRMLVVRSARLLVSEGIEVWVGAGSSLKSLSNNIAAARAAGAAVNLWQADLTTIHDAASTGIPLTWAGSLEKLAAGAQISPARALLELVEAGVLWAVIGSDDMGSVAEAAGVIHPTP